MYSRKAKGLKFPRLFQPLDVGPLIYRNRLFSAPTMMSYVTEGGRPTEALMGYYLEKARGGAAQVTIGDTPVDQEHGAAFPGMFLNKANMAFFGELACGIKHYGAVASFELNHSGWMANPALNSGPPASSVAFRRGDGVEVVAMDEDMIQRTADNFASAALFVKNCGFQGALIHGGHGWLLAQFLSPMVNKRTDKYGSSPENRARFPRMVVERIREAVGKDFVLEYRISGSEIVPEGLSLNETIPFIQSIQDKINLVHVSAGIDTRLDLTLVAHPSIFSPHGCNVRYAEAMKREVSIPVVTVGAIGSPELAERILEEGKADAVAMCRALIADPYLPLKARTCREDEISPCIRCLHCRGHMDVYKHFSCAVNPRAGREARLSGETARAQRKKRVLVVGGGPGGMKAAIAAAERRHEVILAERKGRLGGQLTFTDYDDLKADLRAHKDYLIRMVRKLKVKVLLNTEVDRALADELKPDVIVIAVGAVPIVPTIPGINGKDVMHAVDAYPNLNRIGQRVTVVGGGLLGVETALFLADVGRQVTVLELTDFVAKDANRLYAEALRLAIAERKIAIKTKTECKGIEGADVTIVDADGMESVVHGDTVIYAVGLKADGSLYATLHDCAPEVLRVGDCIKPGTIREAISGGYFGAMEL